MRVMGSHAISTRPLSSFEASERPGMVAVIEGASLGLGSRSVDRCFPEAGAGSRRRSHGWRRSTAGGARARATPVMSPGARGPGLQLVTGHPPAGLLVQRLVRGAAQGPDRRAV